MEARFFSLNQIGGRKNLEDAIMPATFLKNDPTVFILCDGVGGSSHGEVASASAAKHFYATLSNSFRKVETHFQSFLEEALNAFLQDLTLFISQNPGAQNASTTLTVFIIVNNKAYLAWCGDSRIYHLRNGNILYKTQDHSLVSHLVAKGEITEDEAITHKQKNIITRCLNKDTGIEQIETVTLSNINSGDWFLSCTDGLLEQFTEDKFSMINDLDASTINYSQVIDDVCVGKTHDNYSMQLFQVGNVIVKRGAGFKNKGLLILLAILLAAGYFIYKSMNAKSTSTTTPPIHKIDTIVELKKNTSIPIIQKETKAMIVKKGDSAKNKVPARWSVIKKDTTL